MGRRVRRRPLHGIDIGGAATGVHAAHFLMAVSKPVFDKVRADEGSKTTASMPESHKSVVEWLRLRSKDRPRAAVRRTAS